MATSLVRVALLVVFGLAASPARAFLVSSDRGLLSTTSPPAVCSRHRSSAFDEAEDGSSSESNHDDFMAALRSRVKQVEENESKLPLVVLDAMLPRQVLQLGVKNDSLKALVGDCLKNEKPFFGMLGLARLRTGQQVHMKDGVEVEIVGLPEFVSDGESNDNDSQKPPSGGDPTKTLMKLELRAGRRFTIEEVDNAPGKGWTEGRVRFWDSTEQEEAEVTEGNDPLSVARAISKAKEFTCPNMSMPNQRSLVDRWVELAKENEREPGQIDRLLEQLGEIPPPEEPTERALWVGALINPIPAMGVAMEVRPQLLIAKKAEERVRVALDGILKSIKHMDGSARMW